ncbi:hydroxyethylthiazole kinase [Mobilitalea sibirica]|uniref:Hydroxyethylthiazole kinase n=1 Tax=Mobilitalea sibirica TaxID=1462919 RepID=A0A8J7H0S7_9FIRM|nr:hydroxyethylthiazole kinase [Mobilitalea sibirica]MBH1939824.1 hydroxyethylthiazole kinase [Mobilitalea sibirica]
MIKKIYDSIGLKSPLVHNITNYVTVNDQANILLACGASPIMADDMKEVEEITSICDALIINIGTLNERTVSSMIKAGRKANELRHPVVLDPVGVGASKLRTETAILLMKEVHFSVIRGNISEIKTIYYGSGSTKGVDANISDRVTEDNMKDVIGLLKELSDRTDSVIAVTGAIDIIVYKEKAYIIRNGHPMMSKVTGTGCMLSSLIGAFCGANPQLIPEAAAVGICTMGICGELAYEKMKEMDGGTSSYKMYLIDYVSKMNADLVMARAKVEQLLLR